MGPNVKRLVCERASQLAVERAKAEQQGDGGFALAAAVVARMAQTEGRSLQEDLREAAAWVGKMIELTRKMPGGEIYADDEAVAGEVLRLLEERKAKCRGTGM